MKSPAEERRHLGAMWAMMAVLLLVQAVFLAFDLINARLPGLHFNDFAFRWKECAYFLRGVNPFDVISGEVLHPDIGALPGGVGTVPWAFVLGNLINPGFLPYPAAYAWGLALMFGMPVVTLAAVYRWLGDKGLAQGAALRLTLALTLLLPVCWRSAIMNGNQSAVVCCLVILAMCLDDRPWLAGVLLGVAMVKPQVTVLFILMALLRRRYKTVGAAAGLVLAGWAVSFIATGTGPLEMSLQMLSIGSGYRVFMGLFDPLRLLGVPTTVVLVINMACGAAYTVLYWSLAKRQGALDPLTAYTGAAIASSFWFYKQSLDLIVLAIPGLMLWLLFLREKADFKNLAFTFICAGLLYVEPAKTLAAIVTHILHITAELWSPFMMAERLCYIAIGLWLLARYARAGLCAAGRPRQAARAGT